MAERSAFPTYLQMHERVPLRAWWVLRGLGLAVALAVIGLAFVDPPTGFAIFWGLIIPLLPVLFFVAPGFWRNVCPMATVNQLPRVLGFTRALTMPAPFREYCYVIGILLFIAIVPARKFLFEQNGAALGALLIALLVTPFLAGIALKGKSGWCSSMCPLLPVQRLYGQTPFVMVRNAHCRTCVGCVKNCYDFNPPVAYMADLYDTDTHRSGYRKFFAGAFPGLVIAFYRVDTPPAVGVGAMYLQFAGFLLVSLGIFYVLEVFLKITVLKITTLFAVAGLNLYYFFALPSVGAHVNAALSVELPSWWAWPLQAVLAGLSAVWIARTHRNETRYVAHALAPKPARIGSVAVANLRAGAATRKPEEESIAT